MLPSGRTTATAATTNTTITSTTTTNNNNNNKNNNKVSEWLKKGHNPIHKDALALRKVRFRFKLTDKLELPF